jgi:predicted DNA helicase
LKKNFARVEDEISHLENLLQLEQAEDLAQYQAQVLETPLKERQRKGISWYPVRLADTRIGTGGKYILSLERNLEFNQPHQFQPGGQACLFWNAPAGQKVPQLAGTILSVEPSKMEIQLNEDELPDWIDERLIGVDLLFDENSYREMKAALGKVKAAEKNSRLGRLRDICLGWEEAGFQETENFNLSNWPVQHLNDSQKQAIAGMMAARDVFVIHGPPGTGKTTTLTAGIQTALLYMKQVLVCAPSNAAADLLTEKLAAAGVRVLRVGNPARMSEEIFPYTLDYQLMHHAEAREIKRLRKLAFELKKMAFKYKKYYDKSERDQKQAMLKEARSILQQIRQMEQYATDAARDHTQAFVCTLVGAGHALLKDKKFDMVLIDEAGQAPEPATWIPITRADKVVFAGDHCQLPPTIKSKEAARLGLEETLMEKVVERSRPRVKNLLQIQYRMHQKIMGFSSGYFYGGQLKADVSVKEKTIWPGPTDSDTEPLTWIDTAGTGFEEKFHPETSGLSNREEGVLLLRHLEQWLEKAGTVLIKNRNKISVALISPYREQAEWLKKESAGLAEKYGIQIRAGTVDGFQGQEADVVYISLVRSNSRKEIGFLRDTRRMNVAITRAKTKLVVFGDSATISEFRFYEKFLEYVQKEGYYLSAWEFGI